MLPTATLPTATAKALNDCQTVIMRIERLERRNRHLRWGMALMLVSLFVSFTSGAVFNDANKPLATGGLVIQDDTGKVRAVLGCAADGGVALSFFDRRLRPRFSIGINENDMPGLSIKDKEANLVCGLGFDRDGTTRLDFNNTAGGGSIQLRSLPDGTSDLTVSRRGKKAIGLGTSADGTVGLTVIDQEGQVGLGMGIRADGSTEVQLGAAQNTPKLLLRATRLGNTDLTITGNGKRRIGLGTAPDGTAGLSIFAPDGAAELLELKVPAAALPLVQIKDANQKVLFHSP